MPAAEVLAVLAAAGAGWAARGALRERGRARAALEAAVVADRRYRAWSGERARAMAARQTIADVAQASGEAARKVQRGSSALAAGLGRMGAGAAAAVRRLAATTPELAARSQVVRGEVVGEPREQDDWFALMLAAADEVDAERSAADGPQLDYPQAEGYPDSTETRAVPVEDPDATRVLPTPGRHPLRDQ